MTRGPEALRQVCRQLRGAFPDIRFTVEEMIAERDLVAVRWTANMTHAGGDLGFPATQKELTITGMTFARIENGRLAEGWNNWDMLGMMHGIGEVPHAAVARAVET